jgi:hypothetical protein
VFESRIDFRSDPPFPVTVHAVTAGFPQSPHAGRAIFLRCLKIAPMPRPGGVLGVGESLNFMSPVLFQALLAQARFHAH